MADQERAETAPLLNQEDDHDDGQRSPWWRRILTYTLMPFMSILMALTQPVFLALLPLTLVPTGACYWIYHSATQHNPTNRIEFSTLLWIYLSIGVVGTVVVAIVSSVLSYIFAYALFKSETQTFLEEFARTESDVELVGPEIIARRAHIVSRWQYWVFLLLLMFVVVAITEEVLKYVSLPIALKYFIPSEMKTNIITATSPLVSKLGPNDGGRGGGQGEEMEDHQIPNSLAIYIPIIVTATLGFSTIENVGFLYVATITATEPARRLALTVCERIFISAPGHILTGLMIAVKAIEIAVAKMGVDSHSTLNHGNSFSLNFSFIETVEILIIPIVFHGSFDFILLAASAVDGNVGWVHPRKGWNLWGAFFAVVVLELSLALIVWRNWVRLGVRL